MPEKQKAECKVTIDDEFNKKHEDVYMMIDRPVASQQYHARDPIVIPRALGPTFKIGWQDWWYGSYQDPAKDIAEKLMSILRQKARILDLIEMKEDSVAEDLDLAPYEDNEDSLCYENEYGMKQEYDYTACDSSGKEHLQPKADIQTVSGGPSTPIIIITEAPAQTQVERDQEPEDDAFPPTTTPSKLTRRGPDLPPIITTAPPKPSTFRPFENDHRRQDYQPLKRILKMARMLLMRDGGRWGCFGGAGNDRWELVDGVVSGSASRPPQPQSQQQQRTSFIQQQTSARLSKILELNRRTSLLNNLLDQLALEAQKLVQCFQELMKETSRNAGQGQGRGETGLALGRRVGNLGSNASVNSNASLGASTASLNNEHVSGDAGNAAVGERKRKLGGGEPANPPPDHTLSHLAALNPVDLERTQQVILKQSALRLQWDSVRLLCVSLESAVGGFESDIEPYITEMSRIIHEVTVAATASTSSTSQQQLSDLKSFEFNFPFFILKLLSAVKVSVKTYLEQMTHTELEEAGETNRVNNGDVGGREQPERRETFEQPRVEASAPNLPAETITKETDIDPATLAGIANPPNAQTMPGPNDDTREEKENERPVSRQSRHSISSRVVEGSDQATHVEAHNDTTQNRISRNVLKEQQDPSHQLLKQQSAPDSVQVTDENVTKDSQSDPADQAMQHAPASKPTDDTQPTHPDIQHSDDSHQQQSTLQPTPPEEIPDTVFRTSKTPGTFNANADTPTSGSPFSSPFPARKNKPETEAGNSDGSNTPKRTLPFLTKDSQQTTQQQQLKSPPTSPKKNALQDGVIVGSHGISVRKAAEMFDQKSKELAESAGLLRRKTTANRTAKKVGGGKVTTGAVSATQANFPGENVDSPNASFSSGSHDEGPKQITGDEGDSSKSSKSQNVTTPTSPSASAGRQAAKAEATVHREASFEAQALDSVPRVEAFAVIESPKYEHQEVTQTDVSATEHVLEPVPNEAKSAHSPEPEKLPPEQNTPKPESTANHSRSPSDEKTTADHSRTASEEKTTAHHSRTASEEKTTAHHSRSTSEEKHTTEHSRSSSDEVDIPNDNGKLAQRTEIAQSSTSLEHRVRPLSQNEHHIAHEVYESEEEQKLDRKASSIREDSNVEVSDQNLVSESSEQIDESSGEDAPSWFEVTSMFARHGRGKRPSEASVESTTTIVKGRKYEHYEAGETIDEEVNQRESWQASGELVQKADAMRVRQTSEPGTNDEISSEANVPNGMEWAMALTTASSFPELNVHSPPSQRAAYAVSGAGSASPFTFAGTSTSQVGGSTDTSETPTIPTSKAQVIADTRPMSGRMILPAGTRNLDYTASSDSLHHTGGKGLVDDLDLWKIAVKGRRRASTMAPNRNSMRRDHAISILGYYESSTPALPMPPLPTNDTPAGNNAQDWRRSRSISAGNVIQQRSAEHLPLPQRPFPPMPDPLSSEQMQSKANSLPRARKEGDGADTESPSAQTLGRPRAPQGMFFTPPPPPVYLPSPTRPQGDSPGAATSFGTAKLDSTASAGVHQQQTVSHASPAIPSPTSAESASHSRYVARKRLPNNKVMPSPDSPASRSLSNMPPLDDQHTQLILIPLNGMFDLCYLTLAHVNKFGRSNIHKYAHFKAFLTQVVSRSHMEIWEEDSKVLVRDNGSSSGTFLNGVRLSDPGVVSSAFAIQSGDYIQLGKDYIESEGQKDQSQNGLVEERHRCVKMQVVIVPSRARMPQKAVPIVNTGINTAPVTPFPRVPIPQTQPAPDSYQQELERKKRSIERQIIEQHEKLERELKLGQLRISPGRERYIISYSGTSAKVKKLQIATQAGTQVFDVNLKSWDTRRRILIEDMRPRYSRTRNLDIYLDQPGTSIYSLVVAGAHALATFQYTNNLKLQINSLINHSENSPTTHSPRTATNDTSSSSSISPVGPPTPPTAAAAALNGNGVNFCVTGDFRESKWIVIMKFPNSREQRFVGEATGKQIVRKNVRESKWLCNLELEDGEYSQILLSAVVFMCVTGGSS
ncbi:hypothetical protein HK102_004380 [Quaeritorhiza haematococci]|nr:hypothetical protein HK102_004380 [Quaeritorhiza haematococci]